MNTSSLEILCITLCFFGVVSYAYEVPHIQAVHYQRNPQEAEGRIYFSAIQSMFEPYFPITINVPDMISAVGGYMGSMFEYIFGGGSSQKPSSTPRIWDELLREMDILISEF